MRKRLYKWRYRRWLEREIERARWRREAELGLQNALTALAVNRDRRDVR